MLRNLKTEQEVEIMSEKKRILESIRMRMRRNGMTYQQLARKLKVSEVTVKRYFSEERLPLEALDDVCKALGASLDEMLSDLKAMTFAQVDTFSTRQELALSRDEFLFVVFFMVARGYSFEEIDARLQPRDTARLIRALREMEELELVTYRSNQELRSLVSCNARFSPGGALWARYSEVGIEEFFKSKFDKSDEHFKLAVGYLSEEHAMTIRRKLESMEDEIKAFLASNRISDSKNHKRKFYWIAFGYRPMESSVLQVIAERSKLLSNRVKGKSKNSPS
jgi:transcriptional regulator with XRE-family HTH domain